MQNNFVIVPGSLIKSVLLVFILTQATWIAIHAQWLDRFDQNLNSWSGSITDFGINGSNQLMLNAATAGSSYIYRPYEWRDPSQLWTIYFEMRFSPSASNMLRIFLHQNEGRTDASEAYYIEVGENGSEDHWKFYVRKDSKEQLLGQGTKSKLSGDPSKLRMQLKRSSDSSWVIMTDYSGGFDLQTEAVILDSFKLPIQSSFFGIECVYTDTRKDKFLFDDIGIWTPVGDTVPPSIIESMPLGNTQLKVRFNEIPDRSSAENRNNYRVLDFGNPDSVKVDSIESLVYRLYFTNEFIPGREYELLYKNISDVQGNFSTVEKSIKFINIFYPRPIPEDLQISEFMSDPSPSAGLPESEYVEIKNVSDKILNLEGFRLADRDGQSTEAPYYLLGPDEYLIVCNAADTLVYKNFGKTLGFRSIPALNNSGDQIKLLGPNGMVLDNLEYDLTWFGNSDKKDGGYSLELKKVHQSCKGKQSWGPTSHPLGGTPGMQNTEIDSSYDMIAPVILEVISRSEWELILKFNESISKDDISDLSFYLIDHGITIATADLIAEDAVLLLLNQAIVPGIRYCIQVREISDCLGNTILPQQFKFELAAEPEVGDLLWNEILFNPRSGGSDYVELYNNSKKLLQLKGLLIGNPDHSPSIYKIEQDLVLEPETYIAFTEDREITLRDYKQSDETRIFEMELPVLEDAEGKLMLQKVKGNSLIILDSVQYQDDWHNPLLRNKEAVSLEKINPRLSSMSSDHWQSASAPSGFGTPGIKNSQFIIDTTSTKASRPYTISDRVVSPNQDGYRDFLAVRFNPEKAGYKIRMELYDLSGYRWKIISHDIIGNDDVILWNGDDESGTVLLSGNYILNIVMVHPGGKSEDYKELVVVDSGKN